MMTEKHSLILPTVLRKPMTKFQPFAARAHEKARTKQATFEALVEGCWDALWRYAYHTTGNSDDAEDLLSETMLEGFRSFAQFRGDTAFVRWMYRVMTTTRIDMVRRAARRRAESLDAMRSQDGEQASAEIPDESANPERDRPRPAAFRSRAAGAGRAARRFPCGRGSGRYGRDGLCGRGPHPPNSGREQFAPALHRARALLRKQLADYVESV